MTVNQKMQVTLHLQVNPFNAVATFVQSTKTQRFLKNA